MTKIQNPKRFEHLNFDIASNFDIRISSFLFYLLILFLPTQLGRHFWPDFSFVSGIRVDYLSPTLYVTDIIIFLLFITWVINYFIVRANVSESRTINNKNFSTRQIQYCAWLRSKNILNYWQLVVFVIFLIFGIFMSKNQGAGLYGFLKLLEFIFLGFYTAYNFKKLEFNTVLLLFSVGIIFESFLALFQYINQSSIGGIFYWLGERTFNAQTPGIANASVNGELILRPYATFPHPNVLAGYLTIALAMVISNFQFFPRSGISLRETIFNFRRIFYILTLLIGTIALFLTLSRVALLLWLAIVFIWLVKQTWSRFANKKTSILILVVLVFIGSIGIILLLSPLGSRFTNIKPTDESIVVRQKLIKSSLLMIKENPFFGVGLNNFLVEVPKYQKINNYFTDLQPAHNIYLLILSQTGVVGFLFFVWFIGKTYQKLKTQNSKFPAKQDLASRDKFIILSSILILGLFDHYFLTLQQGQLLFSFILGLCWSKFPSQKSLH